MKKRKDFLLLEFFLRALLIDGPWFLIQNVTSEHEALLAAEKCTLIEFVQTRTTMTKDDTNDFVIANDKEWICYAPWHSRHG